MSGNGDTRKITSPSDLVFYTDGDYVDYPVYVLPDFSVVLKRKPEEYIANFFLASKETIVEGEKPDDIVQKVSELSLQLPIPLEEVVNAVKDITKEPPKRYVLEKFKYEVYASPNDYLGDAEAYVVYVVTSEAPYSGVKFGGRKALAIAYGWHERLSAKYPEVSKYAYVKKEYGKRGRAYAWIRIKLPIPTPTLEELFNVALGISPKKEEAKKKEMEITEELKEKLLPEWLCKVYLVAKRRVLRSEYKGAKGEYEVNGSELKESKIILKDKAEAFRNFRARFSRFLRLVTIQTPMGIIIVNPTEEVINRFNRYMNEYAELVRRYSPETPVKPIRLVEIYAPRKIVAEMAREYVEELKASLEDVKKKLEEIDEEMQRVSDEDEAKKLTKVCKNLERREKELMKLIKQTMDFIKEIETPKKVPIVSERVEALKKVI